ncbi:MAG: MipA/OmpV family protein [Giesbergeria sp.]|nr:MipA/OmpV family protein [Giesbergeria sp.]
MQRVPSKIPGRWAVALLLAFPLASMAQLRLPHPVPDNHSSGFTWSLGASVNNGPSYAGSAERSTGVRPVIGLEIGRFTLSSGGGGSLLDFDLDARDSGLTARLFQLDNFRLSGGLRLDGGRKGEDDPILRGLPDVERTLRGRLSAIYDFNKHASLRSTLSQDLLDKQGGATLQTSARYAFLIGPRTEVGLAVGFTLADGTYMRSYLGVPVSAAGVTTALPAFRPGSGMHSTHLGLEVKTLVSDRWVLFGGVGYQQLRGDARRSPLAVKPDSYSVSLGLAYRCCR